MISFSLINDCFGEVIKGVRIFIGGVEVNRLVGKFGLDLVLVG